jgi:hypothetical protein
MPRYTGVSHMPVGGISAFPSVSQNEAAHPRGLRVALGFGARNVAMSSDEGPKQALQRGGATSMPARFGDIIAQPILGGLLHRYN